MSEAAHHTPAKRAAITLSLGLGQTVAFASSFYLMGALGDAVAVDLRISSTAVFAVTSLSLAVQPLLSPAVGRRIDRRGGKPVLLASRLVFAAALALLSVAQGVGGLAAGMMALGAGMALGTYGTPFAILVSLYGEEARRPITGVALLGGLGSAVGWPLTAYLLEQFGWRGACLAWAGGHLIICLPAAAVMTPRTRGAARDRKDGARRPVTWDRRMVQLAVIFACAWFIASATANHLPRLLVAFGLEPIHAAGVAGLVGVAAVSVRFAEFTVLRYLPPLVSTRIATSMHPLGAAALALFGAKAAPLMALGQGAGNGMLAVAKGVLPLNLYGPDNYAYRSALLTQPAQLLQIAGPVVYGLAIAQSPRTAIALSSALCLVMFAMTFGLQARHDPQKEHAAA
ncbi:MFS transporter [Phenylobacterium sp.]|uniref:MFS transporter n=1 Tax=Phenylobacterium sp. TaxID=1871053 RepID=UPI0035B1D724